MKKHSFSAIKLVVIVGCMYGVFPANIPDPDPQLTPASATTQANKPNKVNCSDLNAQLLSWNERDRDGFFIYEQSHAANCTGEEVIIKETEPSKVERWKTNVIISCTVTAAVEVFIIIIIILYWKQIRWSLRKLKCPCEESQNNNSSQQQRPARRNTTVPRPRVRQSRSGQRNDPQTEESELTPMNRDPEIGQSENRPEPLPDTSIVVEMSEASVSEQQPQSNIPETVPS